MTDYLEKLPEEEEREKLLRAFVGMGRPIGHDVQFMVFRDLEDLFRGAWDADLKSLEWRTRCNYLAPGCPGNVEVEAEVLLDFGEREPPTVLEMAEVLRPRGLVCCDWHPNAWTTCDVRIDPRKHLGKLGDLPIGTAVRSRPRHELGVTLLGVKQEGRT